MDDEDLLAVLGEKYSLEVLRATHEPRSAREVSDHLDIPIATCYRRIEALVEAGLLEEVGRQLSDRGRRSSVYRRTVDEVVLSFDGEDVDLSTSDRAVPNGVDRPRDR